MFFFLYIFHNCARRNKIFRRSYGPLKKTKKYTLFHGLPEKFKAWLTAVTRNVAKNKVRGKKIWHESEEAWQHIPSGEPTPEEEILQKEMEKQLRDILRNFSKKQEQKTL